jgi:predicted ATPase/DNA-binding CsgD family transcriptional regulator
MATTLARSSFVGRHSARAFLRDILVKPDIRLVTISGPGGIGKTSLAQALLAELAPEFVDGAAFVPLGELHDPDLVLPAIIHALGMPPFGGAPFERLSARLGHADVLLVLDDLGRVVTATPDLIRLLDACPWVTILATSRTPLGTERELVFPLAPLQVPDPGQDPSLAELRANESVELLVRKVQVADPDFTLTTANATSIAEVCRGVEGIPLALELAAAQLSAFSPTILLGRRAAGSTAFLPDDDSGTEQTLHDLIAWTVHRLSPPSRAVLHTLSILANGSDAAAIAAVCGDGSDDRKPATWVLSALTELVNHGLLHQNAAEAKARFTMPEVVREYARTRLEATGESEVAHRRHARYFLTLAEELAVELWGPGLETSLARFDREHQNFATALRWSLAHAPTMGLRLAANLWRFFFARGYFVEGQRWLAKALANPESETSIPRVRALHGLGVMYWATGDLERALELHDTSFSLAREIGDTWGMAAAQGDRAIIELMNGGDARQARKATINVLEQFRELGDRYSEGVTLAALGCIAQSQGHFVRSARYLQEALMIARQIGDLRGQVLCLFNLGQTARLKGELDRSAAYHAEGIVLAWRLGLQEDVLYSLTGIAGIAVERGQSKRAAWLLGAIPALADWMGVALQPPAQAQLEQDIETTRAALGEELFSRAWGAGRGVGLADVVKEALELTLPSDSAKASSRSTSQLLIALLREGPHADRDAVTGEIPITSGIAEPFGNVHGLSQRELEVLPLLAAGNSDREIAEQLFISCQTATTHVKHIRAKLAVHSRAAVAAYAIRHGIV